MFNTVSIYLAYRVVADFPNKSWAARGGFKISRTGPRRGNITVIQGAFATKADGRRVSADFISTDVALFLIKIPETLSKCPMSNELISRK